MEPIRIRAKLSAYTKGVIPTKVSQLENDENFVKDLNESQSNNFYYVRVREPNSTEGKWVQINSDSFGDEIDYLGDNSGLIIKKEGNIARLKIDQYILSQEEFDRLSNLDGNATYYVYENTPDLYINGGTAFSDGNNEYVDLSQYGIEMNGGRADSNEKSSIMKFELELLPINAKGVYNG
jgi:hypothetical protein